MHRRIFQQNLFYIFTQCIRYEMFKTRTIRQNRRKTIIIACICNFSIFKKALICCYRIVVKTCNIMYFSFIFIFIICRDLIVVFVRYHFKTTVVFYWFITNRIYRSKKLFKVTLDNRKLCILVHNVQFYQRFRVKIPMKDRCLRRQ